MMGALKAMFSFFTMIRMDITKEDMNAMDRRFWMVPTVGALYGLMAAAMMVLLTYHIDPLVASVITFFAIFAFNRFLHIDGMIDVGDGMIVAGTKEDHLRALKDTRIGAGGMAFALMVILISITTASALTGAMIALFMFAAEVLAKVGMVTAAAFGEPGDGMAGNSVRNTTPLSLLYASILAITLIVMFGAFVHMLHEYTELPVMLMDDWLVFLMISFIVSVLTGLVMAKVAKKNFGMVNGDVLGATNEITRATVLLMFLILIVITPVI